MLLRKVGTIIAKTVAKKRHKKDNKRRQNLKKKKNIYIYIYLAKKVAKEIKRNAFSGVNQEHKS